MLSEIRISRAAQPQIEAWRSMHIAPRGATHLGISYRPRQAEALGLDVERTLQRLLEYPFQVIRLGAYWNRIEPAPGAFDPSELDAQIDAAELAGKQIIVCVGALKTFGYPEFFAPRHHVPRPLPERTRIRAAEYASLLAAGTDFIERVVDRYAARRSIVSWQVEHESVDPLGLEHSWRLDTTFVSEEVQAVKRRDSSRPILLNGFLPASLPVKLTQWWQTRDQGDSLTVAMQLADIVGVDYYPRHALVGIGGLTLYLDGTRSPWALRRLMSIYKRLMITEGQAEPWEAVTTPPSLHGREMYSCRPHHVIDNYNRSIVMARQAGIPLEAYLFWGAEYWVAREMLGDRRYLQAFKRILNSAS
jgi:Beta-galactosidase